MSSRLRVAWLIVALLKSSAALCAADPAPASHVLKSGDLEIELMDPDSSDRYNRGVRFTPVAAILRARLGEHQFLSAPEKHDPLTAAAGIFSEFDIHTTPPGFADAKMGESYMKIGVGLLKKDADAYNFYAQHELLKAARTESKWADDCADFRQTCGDEAGHYSYELSAHVELTKRELRVAWTLRNTGTKVLETQQYAHPCVRFDDANVDERYSLAVPADFTCKQLDPFSLKWEQRGREIHFLSKVESPGNLTIPVENKQNGEKLQTMLVRQDKSEMELTCSVSLPCSSVRIYASPEFLSPEQFITLSLKPQESVSWTQSYTFAVKEH
jgi:hypothetical protein